MGGLIGCRVEALGSRAWGRREPFVEQWTRKFLVHGIGSNVGAFMIKI